MSDLIDRQKAINAMQKNRDAIKADFKADLINAVLEVPTVETERDGGYWGWSDDEYETRVCSECEFDTRDYVEYPFCPNCGVLMSDLIDRQAAIDAISALISYENPDITTAAYHRGLRDARDLILRLSSVDPKQKTGTWVESEGSDDWHCSECKFKMPWKDQKTPYCPNCGAKMENSVD